MFLQLLICVFQFLGFSLFQQSSPFFFKILYPNVYTYIIERKSDSSREISCILYSNVVPCTWQAGWWIPSKYAYNRPSESRNVYIHIPMLAWVRRSRRHWSVTFPCTFSDAFHFLRLSRTCTENVWRHSLILKKKNNNKITILTCHWVISFTPLSYFILQENSFLYVYYFKRIAICVTSIRSRHSS